MEEPITCEDDHCDDDGQCDADSWFKDVKCVLESPVCKGELMPGGVVKRVAAARHRLAQAWRGEQSGRGKRFVTKAVRALNQAEDPPECGTQGPLVPRVRGRAGRDARQGAAQVPGLAEILVLLTV